MNPVDKKKLFVGTIIQMSTRLGGIKEEIDKAADVYIDRGYNPAGSDPITQEDLTEFDISLSDFSAMIPLLQNYVKFLTNQTPIQADYMETINRVRTDI